ncbi:repetitive organellar protein-like [Melitaea cinxia]|uniref:repetitive organellar protein-like n=1 Tax=Melitaea cinxia TaxID=113334 RepID=UPI001E27115D|nr:repetitive organellar protein-like [Melitaea cinxia]
MEENDGQYLDTEYKRYLEIIRPYLGQLLDQDVIEICSAWIQRLSKCKDHEKLLRNKYIFAMCYQLAKGVLEEPFVKEPSADDLCPLVDDENSDEISSELEYNIVDLENDHTEMVFKNEKPSYSTILLSGDSDFKTDSIRYQISVKSNKSINSMTYNIPQAVHKQKIMCYNFTTETSDLKSKENVENTYDNCNLKAKTNNVVMKLREIKRDNFMLLNELNTLKEELRMRKELSRSRDDILKVSHATSTHAMSRDSTTALKCKLQEITEARNTLLDKITNLQDKLDNFNYMKTHDFEDLGAKHKIEIINIKTSIREEMKAYYENKLEDLKQEYEKAIKEIQTNNSKEIEQIITEKDDIISEKDKIILSKTIEIEKLSKCIEEHKKHELTLLNNSKFPSKDSDTENLKRKAEELEKRLNKTEKSKLKYFKAYDIKLANLQKEKHLIECSFHLELMRQRAQVIYEMSNEHQTELDSALTKLESKYKEIIANVQSTAVQCRIREQMALESIIQAVCGARNEGMYTNSAQATCPSQLTNKATHSQTRDNNANRETEIPTIFQSNKVGSVIVSGKSFGEESVVNEYCLDSQKLGEMFEKLYIPQRDTGGDFNKK